ncbi:MAG: Smr/MutS family protein [Gammaproteobacteria bacterium]|nr:Smr/MutS family protein [Gammaproteobacteria bacterium]
MTRDEAREHLREFIEYCLDKGFRCVRIVHGKGRGSGPRGPVLKNAVNNWLRKWDPVLAFVSAPDMDGGTGAVYVLLRSG